jgi:predicted dehydrogenase
VKDMIKVSSGSFEERPDGMVVLVGVGYWGPNLLRNLIAAVGDGRVVIVDRSVDRLANALAHYRGVACETSLEDALERHHVVAVIIATPVSTHHALARTALEAGCHVMVEKPLAASSEEGRDLVRLAEERSLTLMVGHTFLFSPRVELIRQCVADGRLGEVQYVTSARLNLGLHQADVSVIWDLAPHDLSIIFAVLDELPVRVRACGRAMVRPDLLDVAFLNLDFPSGVVASVNLSWLAPSKSRSTVVVGDRQMLVYDDLEHEQPIRIYDKGVVLAQPGSFGEHQLTYRHGDILAPYLPAREPLAQEIAHFLACAETGIPCISGGRFGLAIVETLEAAELSWSRGGEAVAVGTVDTLPLEPVGGT